MMQENEPRWRSPEFLLVVIMLAVLTILVIVVLWVPVIDMPKDSQTIKYTDLLEFRKSILAIILTAFGAWVGAGAAYFFGRENLRLAMRALSPKELLRRTSVRQMQLKPLDWLVKGTAKVGDVLDKVKIDPTVWFIPIVKDDGTLNTVLHEDALWRYITDNVGKGAVYEELLKKGISDVLEFLDLDENKDLKKKVGKIYVPVTLDKSASDAYELMQQQAVFLAIVIDDKSKPTHYITTADVRMVLLQAG